MAWGLILLCLILGSFAALKPSGRAHEFKRQKYEEE